MAGAGLRSADSHILPFAVNLRWHQKWCVRSRFRHGRDHFTSKALDINRACSNARSLANPCSMSTLAMANCFAICACSTGLAGSTLSNSSALQVCRRGERNALLGAGAPLPFGSTNRYREGMRETTWLSRRVACGRARAGLGDAPDNEKLSQQSISEDWQYLAKLFAGCTAGAALIKYGSILLPQIPTEPNLVIALLVITTPVVASVVVLTAASSKSSGS